MKKLGKFSTFYFIYRKETLAVPYTAAEINPTKETTQLLKQDQMSFAFGRF